MLSVSRRTGNRRTPRCRRSAAGLIAALCLLLGGPASAADPVLIAAEDDWAPYASAQPGSPLPQGHAVDIVREAFASQGVAVQFVVVPFSRCMLLAQTGKVVGCFNATIVEDNRDAFHWHPTPMFYEELAIFARTGGGQADLKLADLDGRSVGYTLGYTYPTSFTQNAKINKVSAKSDHQLLDLLRAGRVDYVLINTAPALLRVRGTPSLRGKVEKVGVVSQDGFWIAFTRVGPLGEPMAQVFEQGLATLKRSGRYATLQADFWRSLGR